MAEPQTNFERLLLLAEKDPAAAMMLESLTSAPQDPFENQVIDPVQPGSPMAMMSGMPPPAPFVSTAFSSYNSSARARVNGRFVFWKRRAGNI